VWQTAHIELHTSSVQIPKDAHSWGCKNPFMQLYVIMSKSTSKQFESFLANQNKFKNQNRFKKQNWKRVYLCMKSLSGSVVKVVPVFNAKQLVIDNTTNMLWKYAVFFGHGHQPVEAWWSNNYMLAMSNIYPIHIISWFCSHQKGVEWCPIPSARPCPAAGNSK
jgi:hypothetical protein